MKIIQIFKIDQSFRSAKEFSPMKNRWNENDAAQFANDPKGMRVYTSRLLGQEPELVLHGGGNTSVKMTTTDFFGDTVEALFVKGSGWDLGTIKEAGFAPERLDVLNRLAEFDSLSDSDMVEQQRIALLDSKAPNASVEAILHALIPFRYVDHTHANAAIAVCNTENGEHRIRELYGDRVIVIPYVMPGFALAKLVYQLTKDVDWNAYEGMILMNHGVFTFSDDARESYERMINLAGEAEVYLEEHGATQTAIAEGTPNALEFALIRRHVSNIRGLPVIAKCNRSPEAVGYSNLPDLASFAAQGPLTPDHSIFAKRIPAILESAATEDLDYYATDYRAYFERNASKGLTCLDQAPRWAIWPGHGILSFGINAKNASVIGDIAIHTSQVVQMSQALGGWKPLDESDVFEVEYWELEQAKLKSNKASPPLQGKIALVTEAASEIGLNCVRSLLEQGAAVIALDSNSKVESIFESNACLALQCTIGNTNSLRLAMEQAIETFGGLDILVVNNASQANEVSSLLQVAIPFLEFGIDPSISVVGTDAANHAQSIRERIREQSAQTIRVSSIDPDSQIACAFHRSADSIDAALSNETIARLVTTSASESHS